MTIIETCVDLNFFKRLFGDQWGRVRQSLYRELPRNVSRELFQLNPKAFTFDFGALLEFTFTRLIWLKARVGYIANNWIYTTNHKRIAFNYFGFVIFSGIVGMVLATIIRAELAYPGFGVLAGDNAQYLSVVTAHAVVMVFFMIMPLMFGAFANFLLPTQLGVHDVAFPRLNSAAFWFVPAGFLMLCQIACTDRRYNRMNSFSVRDAEILLRSKYFRNLVSMFDHHWFLESTALGVRFKVGNLHSLDHDLMVSFNHGLVKAPVVRSTSYYVGNVTDTAGVKYFNTNTWIWQLLETSRLSHQFGLSASSLRHGLAMGSVLEAILNLYTQITTIGELLLSSFGTFWGWLLWSQQMGIFYFIGLYNWLFWTSSISSPISAGTDVVTDGFNESSLLNTLADTCFWGSGLTFALTPFKFGGVGFTSWLQAFEFNSTYHTSLSSEEKILWAQGGRSDSYRGGEQLYLFDRYVVKVGDYWPRAITERHYQTRFSTFDDRWREDVRGAWARSFAWNKQFELNWSKYQAAMLEATPSDRGVEDNEGGYISSGQGIVWRSSNQAFGFYNFMSKLLYTTPVARTIWDNIKQVERKHELLNLYPTFSDSWEEIERWFYRDGWSLEYTKHSLLSFRWVAVNSVQRKFQNMFITQSYQQRINSNWRELQFTREAWRCRLLATRNQKTLYRRWEERKKHIATIDRLATDVLPGWAMITPFSSRIKYTAVGKVDLGLMGVFLVLNSSIVSSANFLVTYRYLSTLNNRKMRDARSFFTEGVMVASWMMIAANPMLAIGILMLMSDRHWQTSFFDYSGGGDTVLFQHMFWFFGHPEVYVIMIPAFGFNNTLLSFYLRKRVSARASLMYSMYTIAFLGFFVWGHHMYMVGLAHTTRMLFSTLTVMISVPAATKLMHWCVTLVNSSFWVELPFLFTLLFIFFFVSGGISGMAVAHTGMDILFHDSFYVVGHFHVMFAGAAMFASFGAFYFYFPSIVGVKFSRLWGYLHLIYFTLGQLMTVIPMFWLGYSGMPRRIIDYPAALGGWHAIVSGGHLITVASLIAFFIMLFDSMRQGRAAVRTSFGVSRFNTRLNFYLFEVAKTLHIQRCGWTLYRYQPSSTVQRVTGAVGVGRDNLPVVVNYETLEVGFIAYAFIRL